MAEIRRGTAMLLLTAGDEQISTALADGIMAVRGTGDLIRPAAQATFPTGGRLEEAKALTPEQMEVVKAEIDRQKIVDWQDVAHRMRVAMHPEPVDYAGLCFDADVQYGESLYERGRLGRLGERLLIGYAMIVLAFERLFESVTG